MIARSLATRVVKLEVSRRRPNEMLVLWRLPSESVEEVVARARFNAGDRVICVEWLKDQEPPQPEWHSDREMSRLRRPVCEAIEAASEKRYAELGARFPPETEAPADRERQKEYLTSMSDADLMHAIFGVPT